jgi:alkylation response protein AidB-like acyl-CoA dehydrogenase
MDLRDSPAEAAFRSRIRSWLAARPPLAEVSKDDHDAWHASRIQWYRQLASAGWLGLSWPEQYGGRGLGPIEEAIFQEEVAYARAPDPPMLGYIGRPILEFGTEQQKRCYLPPLLACTEAWCQGFSEPGAGSDLASLRTRATLQGDHYEVQGHKIWTSYGQYADYCLLLARTEPDAPRHSGISALIVPMRSPGIRIEPIVTARGSAEFCEVFYDAVRVPRANLLGTPGQGWSIAQTTLTYERGPVDIGFQARYESILRRLAAELTQRGRHADSHLRARLAQAATAVQVLKLQVLRSLSERAQGRAPGPEGSIVKLAMAATEQLLMDVALDVLGVDALLDDAEDWFGDYLYGRAATIYGGSAQIQKNILAQRVLGLPRS